VKNRVQIRPRRVFKYLLLVAAMNAAVLLIAVVMLLITKGDYLAGIRSRLVKRRTTLGSGLKVNLPRGWERDGDEVKFYSLSAEVIATMKISDSSASGRFGSQSTDVPDAGNWRDIDIGGLNGRYTVVTPAPGQIGLPIHVLVSVRDKNVFMSFFGPAEHWNTWQRLLQSAEWLESRESRTPQNGIGI